MVAKLFLRAAGNYLVQRDEMVFWIAGKVLSLALFYQMKSSSEFAFCTFLKKRLKKLCHMPCSRSRMKLKFIVTSCCIGP